VWAQERAGECGRALVFRRVARGAAPTHIAGVTWGLVVRVRRCGRHYTGRGCSVRTWSRLKEWSSCMKLRVEGEREGRRAGKRTQPTDAHMAQRGMLAVRGSPVATAGVGLCQLEWRAGRACLHPRQTGGSLRAPPTH
jgi:hypothetical protein